MNRYVLYLSYCAIFTKLKNFSTDRGSSRGRITDIYQALEIGKEEATADELRESLNFFLKRPPVKRPHKIVERNQPAEKTTLVYQVRFRTDHFG